MHHGSRGRGRGVVRAHCASWIKGEGEWLEFIVHHGSRGRGSG